jgi:LmbE family N-acetylglucosaminyl deacetylase
VPHWRAVPPSPVRERLVIVAPRPGDETLACAGLLLWCDHHRVDATIVAVTDGEPRQGVGTVGERTGRTRTRVSERDAALTSLGLRPDIRRLGLDDGCFELDDGCLPQLEDELECRLAALLDERSVCVAPWRADGPQEYEATARAAAAAAAEAGAGLWETPVWGRVDDRFDLALARQACALDLGPLLRARKRAAVTSFRQPLVPVRPGSAHAAVEVGRAVQALTTSVEWYWSP